MAWYDNAVFYHIYPLGLTGAPKHNDYGEPVHRLPALLPWIRHIRSLGCSALYIGPLFESVGHGYETTDYYKLDSRLGTNEDLKNFVSECHRQGLKVILDGVFNHVGRDFFAFADLKQNREHSPYRDWFCNVNFYGNNEYNDGFSYDNWGGFNLLVKLNQRNGYVQEYLCNAVRMWVSDFDIDGLRLDAADVLDFGFMQALRRLADEVKPDFWLMGEVIHGDYTRWVNAHTLHSVTDYNLHKALYSGHNDHNYFEIAHTVKRLYDMGLNHPGGMKLYSFADNHDVERIYTKLWDKGHFVPVHILLYTLPGIPSIYYGSEFGVEGHKEKWSDDSLRPALRLEDFPDAVTQNPLTRLIAQLGHLRQSLSALQDGDYRELSLTTKQYAFSRTNGSQTVIVAVNNDGGPADMCIPAPDQKTYVGALSGLRVTASNHCLCCTLSGNSGEIWIPEETCAQVPHPGKIIADCPQARQSENSAADAETKTAQQGSAADAETKTAQQGSAADIETARNSEHPADVQNQASNSKLSASESHAAMQASTATPEENPSAQTGSSTSGQASSPVTLPDSRQEWQSVPIPRDLPYEKMTVQQLQSVILEKMAKNGPVTERMRRDVTENIWHNSLVVWAKSFR